MQQVRAKGDAVQPVDLAREDTAFQTCMNGNDLGLCTVLCLVHSNAAVAQGTFAGVGPSGIVAVEPHGAAQQLGQGLQLAAQQLLRRGHRAAQGEAQDGFTVVQFGNAEVQRGLHKARHIHAHGLHAPWHQEQGLAQPLDRSAVQCLIPAAALFGELQTDLRVGRAVFGLHLSGKLGSGRTDALRDAGGQHQCDAAFLGDDILLCTAGKGQHRVVHAVFGQQGQPAAQQGDGVGAALVDLGAGVPAYKAGHVCLYGGAGHSCTGDGQMAFNAASACTACGQHPLFLRVDVDEQAAFQIGKLHGRCTQQAHLFADGQHDLQRRVGDVLCVQHSQCVGHGNAVVAAQRSALGADIIAVHHQLDGILFQIQRAGGGLVAHHVQMALQDQGRLVLVARRGRCLDEHIAHFVLTAGKAVRLCKLHAVVAQCLFMMRGVRDAADLFKIMKNRCRFQIG